ncbi:MAG: hypothetical protein GX455_17490 [Phycisphaerae bacterium]|nr:hypothetical protein [Phycisphaerae bacterium]
MRLKTGKVDRIMVLRILLVCAGFGWVISVFGVFMPWSFVAKQLTELGAQNLPNDPMLNYWLRMTAGAFSFIGLAFFALSLRPQAYLPVIRFAAVFLIVEGVILGTAGLVLELFPIPYCVDSSFCLVIGIGILLSARNNMLEKRDQGS